MPDIDKVISQIEHCVKDHYCGECEYKGHMSCRHFLLEKVLVLLKQQAELLKEQEAVEPVFEVKNPNVVGQFHCGNCHHAFGLLHYKFCPECGRKVKWND